MPTTNDASPEELEAAEQPTEQAEQPPAPAAEPAYDPRADIQALRQENLATLQMIREGFTMLASNQQGRPDAGIPDLSDEQIESAIAEGKGAQAIRQMVAAQTARATADLQRTSVQPLAELVNTHGIDAIAALARQAAEQSVAEPLKPYVSRYRAEIDQAVNGMAPQLRLKVDNIAHAQALILGHHMQDIIEEERQKVIRAVRENPASVPGAAVGRQPRETGPAVPTADELFGKNSPEARMIREAGGEDAWIAKNSKSKFASQNWGEYVKRHEAMHGKTEGTA